MGERLQTYRGDPRQGRLRDDRVDVELRILARRQDAAVVLRRQRCAVLGLRGLNVDIFPLGFVRAFDQCIQRGQQLRLALLDLLDIRNMLSIKLFLRLDVLGHHQAAVQAPTRRPNHPTSTGRPNLFSPA